jgi:REP element-mobilizing transposase RayT
MTRAWRIEYEGALYHVLSRGNDRRPIFLENDDRLLFLETLGEMSERFEIDIFAYVLMDNHYHLLFRTHREDLSESMQWPGATYTRRFNIRHDRSGHLFQGRFKNMLVENDAYLLQLSYYIHRNPLRAGIVKRLASHRWSSYPVYAYGKSNTKRYPTNLIKSGYPESPSDLEFVRILDARLRGNDGRAATLCHTREGGYPVCECDDQQLSNRLGS